MDFEYKTFLSHLTVYGKSYMLEMSMPNSQCPVRLMYEEEQCYDEGMKSSSVFSLQSSNGSREVSGGKKLFESNKRMKLESPTTRLDECWWFEDEEEVIDEDYTYFLDNVRIFGGSMILNLPDSGIVKYEENEKVDDGGVDVKEEDGQKVQVKQELGKVQVKQEPEKIQVSAAYRSYMESLGHMGHSVFRNKLLDALSSPFNQNEYEDPYCTSKTEAPPQRLNILSN